MSCTVKDIRKGTRIVLKNGWEADVLDNLTNRQTRMCKVYGTYTEMGSVYTSDIVQAHVGGYWEVVTHDTKTLKIAQERAKFGF